MEISVSEAGRRGGNKVKARNGLAHYVTMGQKGGSKIVEQRGAGYLAHLGRIGGGSLKLQRGREYYVAISRKGVEARRTRLAERAIQGRDATNVTGSHGVGTVQD